MNHEFPKDCSQSYCTFCGKGSIEIRAFLGGWSFFFERCGVHDLFPILDDPFLVL